MNKNPLKSRKLWCTIVTTLLSIATLFFAPEIVENAEQFLLAISPVLVYILGQSAVDCCANIKGKNAPQIEAQNQRQRNEQPHGGTDQTTRRAGK